MSWRGHRFAPAPGTPLCHIDAVPDGACKELRFGEGDDSFNLLLYRRGDEVRGYVNCCPHFSLPLNAQPGEFLLLRNSEIMCAFHCAIFRLEDGHCVAGPAEGMGLEPVPVLLDGAQIRVGAP